MMRVERYVTADAADRVLRPGDILGMTGFMTKKIARVGVCVHPGKIVMGPGYGVISTDDVLAGSRHRWRRYHIYNLERDVNFDNTDLVKLAHGLVKERFTDSQIISRIWSTLDVTDDTYQTASDVIGSHVLRRNFFTIKKA